jgi:hypothetical protein
MPVGVAAGLGLLMVWLAGAPLAPGAPALMALFAPHGELAEFPSRFSWSEVSGANLYEIFVAPADVEAEPLFRQRGPSPILDLAFEDGAEPPPGDYVWEVLALRDGRPIARGAASFTVGARR